MDDLSEREQAILSEWVRSSIDAAIYAGLIVPPWRPTERAYSLLYGYFGLGFTPEEGAEALFARRH